MKKRNGFAEGSKNKLLFSLFRPSTRLSFEFVAKICHTNLDDLDDGGAIPLTDKIMHKTIKTQIRIGLFSILSDQLN